MSVLPLVSRWVSVIALAVNLLFLTTLPCKSAEQTAAAAAEKVKAQEAALPERIIADPDVATRATEVANFIRNSNTKLASGAGVKAINESLPNTARLIELEASMTAQVLEQQPTLDSLERQQLVWRP